MKKFIVYFCIFILFIAGVSISFAATEKGSAEKSDEDIRIGLAIANMSNPYMIILGEEGKKKMAELGLDPQQLLIRDPQDDVTKQIHHIENFISQGVDVIIVQACDSDAIVPAVKDANRAGIPVVCLTRPVNGGEVMQLARTDNISGSREITDAICKAMTTLGKTKLLVVDGAPGVSATRERGQGFDEAMAKYPEIEILARQPGDYSRQGGLEVTENLLEGYPEAEVIYAFNDPMALGALAALKAANRMDIMLYGFDGLPEVIEAIDRGEIEATQCQQPSLQIGTCVETAVKYARTGIEPEDEVAFCPCVIYPKGYPESVY